MSAESTPGRADRLPALAHGCGLAVALIGACVLVGWLLGSEALKGIAPDLPTTKPMTAVALVCLGLAIVLLRDRSASGGRLVAARALGGAAAAIGALVLLEYVVGGLGFDQVPFADAGTFPGRPAPQTAIAIASCGLAVLALDADPPRHLPASLLLLCASFVILATLIGYAYGVEDLRGPSSTTGVGVAAELALLLVVVGLAFLRPDRGALGFLRGDDAGAIMARRLVPLAILIPLAIGAIRLRAGQQDLLSPEQGVAVTMLASILIALTLIALIARVLRDRSRERDAALAELEESEVRHRSTVESVGDVVFRTDAAGRWSYLNPAWTQSTGWPLETSLGQSSLSFVHPDDREAVAGQLLRLSSGERTEVRYSHRFTTSEGQVRWADTAVRPVVDPRGDVAGYAGTLADVTERKLTQRKLEQSSRHFDLSHDLIATFDLDGVFRQLNGAWGPALGWSHQDLLGRSVLEIVHPRDHERFAAALTALGLGRPAEFTIQIAKRGGGWRSTEWSAAPELESGLFYGSGRDITERLEFERVLERERRQLAYAQRLARVGSWELDPATGERTWSAQQFRNHGFDPEAELPPPEEVIARIHPEDVERVREMTSRIERGAADFRVDYRLTLPNGDLRTIEVQGRPFDAADGSMHLIGTSRDVTAERDAERLKDEFLGLVSHELRTPLTSIIGYAELLAEVEAERLSEQGRRFIDVIERNSRRELALIADLLLLSRINAGAFEIEIANVDVGALAAATVEAAGPSAAHAGVELRFDAPPGLVAEADPHRVAQVLENLVSNAIKFTSPGGEVRVRVEAAGAGVSFSVADTGIGIAREDMGRLFDRMYRAAEAERRHIQGSGLGLTIVKAIVDAHDATIEVVSEPGRGSTFTVALPRRAAARAAPRREAATADVTPRPRRRQPI